jgi:hypothetical protein
VRLVPTLKTATAETVASDYAWPLYCDVGLPDVLVSDRPGATRVSPAPSGRYCTRRWAPHSSSARRTTTAIPTVRVERVTGAIADVLRLRRRQL